MMPSKTYIAMILAASMFAGDHAAAQFTVACSGNVGDNPIDEIARGRNFGGGFGSFVSGYTDRDSCDAFKKQLETGTITATKFTVTCTGNNGAIGSTRTSDGHVSSSSSFFISGLYDEGSCVAFKNQLEQLEAPTTTESEGCLADDWQCFGCRSSVDWQCLAAQVQAQAQAAAAAKAQLTQAAAAAKAQAAAAAKAQAAAAAQAQAAVDAADAARLAREAEMRAEIAQLTAQLENAGFGAGMFGLKAGDESEGVSAGAVAATAVQTATSDNKSTTDSTVVALLAVLVVLAVMNVALQMVPRAGQQVAAPYRDLEGHQNMENMRKTSYYEPRTSVAEI